MVQLISFLFIKVHKLFHHKVLDNHKFQQINLQAK